ncbi:UDP-glucosyl transferase 85A7 [Actinidia rufa]|uniref:UDP-glucosyl transferase 85A7 n=1 Tax=Actinidia rufa TaxID=165716 RepID=A0A7J0FYW9_9ERIC|nr:UDP-glucosyl transferase 85A7 [Actinidia rufa]
MLFASQCHSKAMSPHFLTLAKLLHSRGFHITFVNSEFNHKRLLKSRAHRPQLVGLQVHDHTPTAFLCWRTLTLPKSPSQSAFSLQKNFLGPFRDLLAGLNDTASSGVPPVTCLVMDGILTCTLTAAEELGIPRVIFWTLAACGFLGYKKYPQLIEQGIIPLKEADVLNSLSSLFPCDVYAIGPLHLQLNSVPEGELKSIGSNFWEEAAECIKWLNTKEPKYNLVVGESVILPHEFWEEAKDTAFIASCGVSISCWPFFADQQINCRYCCTEWGVGMEIDNDVKREEVEKVVRELMEGEKRKEMERKTLKWKKLAEEAVSL